MDCVVSADIGAGMGAKVGVFDLDGELLADCLLPVKDYPDSPSRFADRLAERMREALARVSGARTVAAGIACPGLYALDGTAMIVANLPFLTGVKPGELVRERLGIPVRLINDAAAGGMAEWFFSRRELAYWVLGGGWGGTWMDADGKQHIPSMGWSGRIQDLNCINEPGFAVSLSRSEIEPVLAAHGLTWNGLVSALPPEAVMRAAAGGDDVVRAEAVTASCLALRRMFIACCRATRGNTRILAENGRLVEGYDDDLLRLAERGFEPAVRSAGIFIEVWALAVVKYYRMAAPHGLSPSVPVHLAGGLSHMSDSFLPALSEKLRQRGLSPALRVSECHERGLNANLLGAASLAIRSLDAAATGL
jgi:predicted NBD/HSP70 family sugar kinase